MIGPLPPPVHGSSMMTQYIKESAAINKDYTLDWVNLSTSRSIEEIGKGGVRKYFRMMKSLCKTFWMLLVNKYDLCYIALTCHGSGFMKDAPFALICKLFGRKLIIHQHNKGMSKDLASPWRKKILKTVYKNTTVILLSWKLYPDIEEVIPRKDVRICPNGIPVEPTLNVPLSYKSLSYRNDIPHILFLSNLIPSKGIYVLLDALNILKTRGYRFVCSFVGAETKEISREVFRQEAVSRGLSGYVKYLGEKYGDEKYGIFTGHDIFVFPTFYAKECFPLALLEAMQAGLPCISTDEGAIPEILDGNGIIVRTRNSRQIADAIENLITDEKLYLTLSRTANHRFRSNYTIDRFENNFIGIIDEGLENRK